MELSVHTRSGRTLTTLKLGSDASLDDLKKAYYATSRCFFVQMGGKLSFSFLKSEGGNVVGVFFSTSFCWLGSCCCFR